MSNPLNRTWQATAGRVIDALSEPTTAAAPGAAGATHFDASSLLDLAVNRHRPDAAQRIGSLQLLGLAAIRERLGERWERTTERVHEIVARILRNRLDSQDVFTRVDDETYVILFAHLGCTEAEFKARVIAEEITRLICGEVSEANQILVSTIVAEINGAIDLTRVTSVQALSALIRTSGQAEARPAAGYAAVPTPEPDEHSIDGFLHHCQPRFRPVWNVRNKVISGFGVTAINLRTDRPASVTDDPYLRQRSELTLAIDCMVLRAAIDGLQQLRAANRRAVVIFSLHFDTYSDPHHRQVYVKLAQEIPSALSDLLAVNIIGIPSGTPSVRLHELNALLRQHCRSTIIELPFDHRVIGNAANVGSFAVSTQLSAWTTQTPQTIQEMRAFVQRAKLFKLSTTLRGASTIGLARAAVGAGFDYISGDAIGRYQDEPGAVMHFDPANLHAPT